MNIDSKKADSD